MRFRLSTIFLLVVIVAISLGWLLDHVSHNPKLEIIGSWSTRISSSSEDQQFSEIEIREDMTFTRIDSDSLGSTQRIDGYYSILVDGEIRFVVSPLSKSPGGLGGGQKSEFYQCRCAVDDRGNLLIGMTFCTEAEDQAAFRRFEYFGRNQK